MIQQATTARDPQHTRYPYEHFKHAWLYLINVQEVLRSWQDAWERSWHTPH